MHKIFAQLLASFLACATMAPGTDASSSGRRKLTPEAAADEVNSLPGWDGPLPSRMFAGHVDAGSSFEDGIERKMFEHYFFVESEGDPAKDPLIVWTNGGPGASSFFGLFVELGPFYTDATSLQTEAFNTTGVPTLFRNEHTWTKLGSVLIVNSPPPVGYSYCTPAGQTGNGSSCGTWNDTKTATHNAIWLESWLERFPAYADNDWYIIGESYAGIYVPTLVRHMRQDPNSNISSLVKGFAVGDGCVGTKVLCGAEGPGPLGYLTFFHGHGQFSDKLYRKTMSTCPKDQLLGFGTPVTDPECKALLTEVNNQIGPYYAYNLYDACWYQNSLSPPHKLSLPSERSWWGPPQHSSTQTLSRRQLPAVNDYPCGGPHAMFVWIERPEVKKALHVDPDAFFFSGDNGAGLVYNLTEPDLMPFYYEVAKETSMRVLIYNGDTDPSINSFEAQNWTSSLGLREVAEWRPWTLDGKSYLGGYVTRYEGNLDFLTIRGSGHMVPEYKPKATFEFLQRWLKNEDWKTWQKSSSRSHADL